jgi:putative acetyltransferase
VAFILRFYRAEDEAAVIELWRRTWQQAFPQIDFTSRLDWWRKRWREELVPKAEIAVAIGFDRVGPADTILGFVTVDREGYLDQLVVAPEHWGTGVADLLMEEAKRISPKHITLLVNTDNARAIRFYERNGFVHAGEDVNPTSGRPVLRMEWRR